MTRLTGLLGHLCGANFTKMSLISDAFREPLDENIITIYTEESVMCRNIQAVSSCLMLGVCMSGFASLHLR